MAYTASLLPTEANRGQGAGETEGWTDMKHMKSINVVGMECCVSFSVESSQGRARAVALNGN